MCEASSLARITGAGSASEGQRLKIISLSRFSFRPFYPAIHGKGGSRGGSFSSGLAVWGPPHVTESERCLIWESEASLSPFFSPDCPCPHNLQPCCGAATTSVGHCNIAVLSSWGTLFAVKKVFFVYLKAKKQHFFSNITTVSIWPVVALYLWFQKQPIGCMYACVLT